jgi:Na+/phosphate symporter
MFQYKNLENLTKKISEQAEQEQNKVNKQHAKISTYLFYAPSVTTNILTHFL